MFICSSVAGELTIDVPALYKIRSMALSYGDVDRQKMVNDYRLFGIINEALKSTWNANKYGVKIENGLTFNTNKTTSGELESNEFDVSILIQTKKRTGKLLYNIGFECRTANRQVESADFDLIEETRFYTEMKRLTIQFANGCPN